MYRTGQGRKDESLFMEVEMTELATTPQGPVRNNRSAKLAKEKNMHLIFGSKSDWASPPVTKTRVKDNG